MRVRRNSKGIKTDDELQMERTEREVERETDDQAN